MDSTPAVEEPKLQDLVFVQGKSKRDRAVVIAWHRYQPHVGESYRVLFENWLKLLPIWAKEVDALYLIDSDMNFDELDRARIAQYIPQVHILKRELDGHHWVQFKWAIPQIKEQNMLFLDNDVVITQSGIIDGWFKSLEDGNLDFVGSFDGSGGMHDLIVEKYPVMKLAGNRMGSYYFILTQRLLKELKEYTFEPNYFEVGTYIPELDHTTVEGDWLDSFGWFTLKMLARDGSKMLSIADPRQSIYLQPTALMAGEQDWEINKDPENPTNLGYYHLRNGNLANYIITSLEAGNKQDYWRELSSVKREYLRSLAWFQYMDRHTLNKFQPQIDRLLSDTGVSREKWDEYMSEFIKYHELP